MRILIVLIVVLFGCSQQNAVENNKNAQSGPIVTKKDTSTIKSQEHYSIYFDSLTISKKRSELIKICRTQKRIRYKKEMYRLLAKDVLAYTNDNVRESKILFFENNQLVNTVAIKNFDPFKTNFSKLNFTAQSGSEYIKFQAGDSSMSQRIFDLAGLNSPSQIPSYSYISKIPFYDVLSDDVFLLGYTLKFVLGEETGHDNFTGITYLQYFDLKGNHLHSKNYPFSIENIFMDQNSKNVAFVRGEHSNRLKSQNDFVRYFEIMEFPSFDSWFSTSTTNEFFVNQKINNHFLVGSFAENEKYNSYLINTNSKSYKRKDTDHPISAECDNQCILFEYNFHSGERIKAFEVDDF